MKKFNNISELIIYIDYIPEHIALDVLKRITSWLSVEGNTAEDEYILKQLEYASSFLENKNI